MNQHYFDVPFAFSGDVTAIPDPLQTGGTVSFTEGWNYNYQRDLATDPAALPIDRSTMNWLLLQITTALQSLQQNGVPEFILASQNGGTAYSYAKGAVVNWSASGSAPFTKFVNLNASNTNTPSLSDPTGATTGWQIDVDPISTSAQAAAGTDNASIMTPLLVAQQTALRALLAGSSTQVFNVGPATATTHAPEVGQVQRSAFNYAGLAGGTANAITATLSIAPGSYTDYLVVVVRVASNNTGSTSLNVNGLGAVPVIGAAHQTLQGGELIAGGFACFAYSMNYSEAILLWATGGAEQVGPATQSQHAVQLGQADGRYMPIATTITGQCKLSVTSSTILTLAPYNGNQISVGGAQYTIPSGGITMGTTGLVVGTTSVTAYSVTSNVMTLTSSLGASLSVGSRVYILNEALGANGTYVVTAATSTTFSFAFTHSNTSGSESGCTAQPVYYVYVSAPGGALTLSAAQTGYTQQSNGAVTMTGNTNYTLVGMVMLNNSGFVDNQQNRWCINWFQRKQRRAINGGTPNQAMTNTASPVSINSVFSVNFLMWADDTPQVAFSGTFALGSTPSVSNFGFSAALDTIGTLVTAATTVAINATYQACWSGIGCIDSFTTGVVPSEGGHSIFMQGIVGTNGGTITVQNGQIDVSILG